MFDAQRLWNTLLENVVFMLLVLPLVGAGLTLLSRPYGIDAIRRTALTNALLSFALALLMLSHYDAGAVDDGRPRQFQMVSRLRWIAETKLEVVDARAEPPVVRRTVRGPNIQLAVGVDGVSLWFVALTTTLMIPAIVAKGDVDRRRPDVFYALLLVAEAAAIAVFAALDVVVLIIGMELLALALFLLIGLWGGEDRRIAARRFYLIGLPGSLLVAFGLIAVVLAHSWMLRFAIGSAEPALFTFNIAELVHGTDGVPSLPSLANSAGAGAYWDEFAPWIFAALLLGFAVRASAFPLHAWMLPAASQAPPAAGILLAGPIVLAGSYGWIRFVVPLFAPLCLALSGILVGVAVFAAVYFALLALAQGSPKQRVTYAGLMTFSLWAATIFSLNAAALAGGILLGVGASFALAVLLVAIDPLDALRPTLFPRQALAFALGGLTLVGAPGTSGFSAGVMTILGVFRGNAAGGARLGSAFWCLVAGLLVLWALLQAWEQVFRAPETAAGRPGHSPPAGARDLTLSETAGLLPVVAAILWIGLVPQFFIRRMEPSLREILAPYKATAAAEPETAE